MAEDQEPEEEQVPDEPKVLTKEDLRNADPNASIPRKLVPIPQFGGSVWVWAVSIENRLIINEHAGIGTEKYDQQKFYAAYVSMALRDSGEDDAQQVFIVPGPDAKLILQRDASAIEEIVQTSMALTVGTSTLEEAVEGTAEFFGRAEAILSCVKHICSVSGASEDCPVKSSGMCPTESSSLDLPPTE